MSETEPVAILAGTGELPGVGLDELQRQGRKVAIVAGVPGCDPLLLHKAERAAQIPFWQWQQVVDWLQSQGVRQAYFLGKTPKEWLQRPVWDQRARQILGRLETFSDDAVLGAFAQDLAEHGVCLGSQATLLAGLLAPAGQWSGPPLTPDQRRDVAYGYRLAKALGAIDVGQVAVVKGGTALALEAIEGTDACLRRGAQLGGPGAVAVKVAKPRQDPRFDLPTVGPHTVGVLVELGYAVLAVEAGRTLVLAREQLIAQAQAHGLRLLGYAGQGARDSGDP